MNFKNISPTKTNENPYVKEAEGQKEWNDRFINMKNTIRYWQISFFATIISVIILSLVIAKIASESKVQPFIVETNKGIPVSIKPLASLSAVSPKDRMIINYAVNQFIINARTIIKDGDAEKELLNRVYAYSADNTIPYLHDYFQKNNPFELAAEYSVAVDIVNSFPISNDTWQVIWDETKRSSNTGIVLSTNRWIANVSYKFSDVNTKFINDNPFGLYVSQVSWSKNQVN